LSKQEKRLLDAYREGIIELDELRNQKAKVAKRLHVVKAKQKAIQHAQEGTGQPEITLSDQKKGRGPKTSQLFISVL